MATNTVSINIRGDTSDIKAKLNALNGQLARLGTNATTAKTKFAGLGSGMGSMIAKASALTAGFIGISSAIRLMRSSIETLSQFGYTMSQVEAISGASGEALAAMSAKARELGATTMFSASQAAEGLKFLSMAGFSAKESVDALGATLNLAQAGSIDLGRAADIMSNIMSAFAISASEAESVADDMATTAASANTDIQQLGDAMKYVGTTAMAMGISMTDVSAAVGTLSNAGLQASMAGTGLRMILAKLALTTSTSEEALQRMGVSLEEVNPEKVGLTAAMERLSEAGMGGSEALAIFGAKGAAAASALVAGIDTYRELQDKLESNDGAAKSMAETMENNLHGSIMMAKAAFQELILQTGDNGLGGALKGIVEKFTAYIQLLTGSLSPMDKNFKAAQKIKDVVDKLRLAIVAMFAVWAFGKVLAGLKALGVAVVGFRAMIVGTTTSATAGFGAATTAATAFKAALISTGVGALVVALGSIVAWATTWGDETERNEMHLRRVKRHYDDITKQRLEGLGGGEGGDKPKETPDWMPKAVQIKAVKDIKSIEELDEIIAELERQQAADAAQLPRIAEAKDKYRIRNPRKEKGEMGYREAMTHAQVPVVGYDESPNEFRRRLDRESAVTTRRMGARKEQLEGYRSASGVIQARVEAEEQGSATAKFEAKLRVIGEESQRRANTERGVTKELTKQQKIAEKIAALEKDIQGLGQKRADVYNAVSEAEGAMAEVDENKVEVALGTIDEEEKALRKALGEQKGALDEEKDRLAAIEARKKAREKAALEKAQKDKGMDIVASGIQRIGGGGGVGQIATEAERQAKVQDKIRASNELIASNTSQLIKLLGGGQEGEGNVFKVSMA